jgi:hypothetical protein
MHFDFRFLNAAGKWESKGHHKGADRTAALQSMSDAGVEFPAGKYMSRPRGRQKNWDLFSLDHEGQIKGIPHSPRGAASI